MSWIHRLAPRASLRARLLAAAVLWSAIGAGLLAAGIHWLVGSRSRTGLAVLPVAIAAGWLKGRFLLAPRAEANARRIVEAGDDRCLGGVFSWGAWGVALAMMGGGMLLRRSAIPRPWLGIVYAAAGVALASASAPSWRRWRRSGRPSS